MTEKLGKVSQHGEKSEGRHEFPSMEWNVQGGHCYILLTVFVNSKASRASKHVQDYISTFRSVDISIWSGASLATLASPSTDQKPHEHVETASCCG